MIPSMRIHADYRFGSFRNPQSSRLGFHASAVHSVPFADGPPLPDSLGCFHDDQADRVMGHKLSDFGMTTEVNKLESRDFSIFSS